MWIQCIAVGLYFALLLSIGLLARKKNTTEQDFVLGSRKLNFWVTAISAHADDMSSWLFMAFPMAVFLSGPYKIWVGIGLIVGMFCSWQFIAGQLRRATEKYQSNTLSTFFEKRFQDHSGIIRMLSAIMTLFFLTYYLSAGLVATGRLFESLFHINYYIGITVAMAIMVSYIFTGGFVSVAWTDFAQGMFLLCMIVITPLIAITHIDTSTISSLFTTKGIAFSLIPDASFASLFSIFSLFVGWGLGYFGQPHILTKFMAIRDPNEVWKSKYFGISWQIIALAAASAVGLIAVAFFPEGVTKPEMIFVEMTKSLFHPFLTAFIVCGVFAANLSTMDAQILVCGSVFSEDLYKGLWNKQASPAQGLKASRIGVIAFALIAFFMAYGQSATIMRIVEYAWSGLGSAFGPVILAALYSKQANRYGAIAGISAGGLVAAVWPSLNPFITDLEVVPMIPGFAAGLAAIHLVSRLTQPSEMRLEDVA